MIGLDIGTRSIKVVELDSSKDSWNLRASGIVGYTGNSPDKFVDEKEFQALSAIIKNLIKQVNVSGKDVSISLPESAVFTRSIKFPNLSDEEVAAAVKWESEQYIPIPINEAIVQHTILERGEGGAGVSVLLVAAPRDVVEKYVKVVRLAGLVPTFVETELIASSRSLCPGTGVSLLVDIGAGSTNIAICEKGNLVFSRSVPVAGVALTRALSQGLSLQDVQSEEYKKTYGLTPGQLENKVKVSLESVVNMLIDEIKKAVHFYQTEEKGAAPNIVVLSGGSSLLKELPSYFTNMLGMETVLGNPFSKINMDPDTQKSLASYAPYYAVACGLAMRKG